MKKIIITGLLLVGAASFSNTSQPSHPAAETQMAITTGKNPTKRSNSDIKNTRKNMDMRKFFTPDQRIAAEKNRITIQEKRLEVRKSLLEKNPDWKKIEKLNLESATLQAKNRTEMQKLKFEVLQARENSKNISKTPKIN